MYTIFYKGSIIHGYCNNDTVQVSFVYGPTIDHRMVPREFRSLRAAKLAITKFNKLNAL
jgi:hypothetical protein